MTSYLPSKKAIGELLSMTNPPIYVPEWQRNYSWTTSEIETFWQDLIGFDEQYPGDNITGQEYFLGSVVMVESKDSHLLLDGQQRLASSAILLSVIRDFLKRMSNDAALRTSNRYLTDFDDAQNKTTYKITLNRFDRDFFRREILENRNAEYQEMEPQIDSHRKIRSARKFFTDAFEKKYGELGDPEACYQWALRIQRVLTGHMSVVAVTSDDEDNAANVFETLNDRGIGLSTPDLLRNLILRRTPEDRIEEAVNLWEEVLGIEGDASLNQFIRHYWISYNGDVKTQSLYRVIKAQVLESDVSSIEFSRQLRDSSLYYRDIINSNHEKASISSLLRDISELGATLLYPAVLSVFEIISDDDQIEHLLRALIVTFVRHNVIGGLENSQLETIVYSIAQQLRKGASVIEVIDQLKDFSPDDERFKASFETASISRAKSARYILKKLEENSRKTEELDVAGPDRVHLEHIYPRTPKEGERWGNHASMVNRIGNLTLLSRRLNVTIRNSNFADKLPHYKESEIKITNDLCNQAKWTDGEIDVRQAILADDAVKIWGF